MISFTCKVVTKCLSNSREHYRIKAKRIAAERLKIKEALRAVLYWERPIFVDESGIGREKDYSLVSPVLIKMTRVAPSKGLDDDNLYSALKGVRDEVTEVLGLSTDRDPLLRFEVSQRQSTKHQGYSVEVIIHPYRELSTNSGDVLMQSLSSILTSSQVRGLGVPKLVGARVRLDCDGTIVDLKIT